MKTIMKNRNIIILGLIFLIISAGCRKKENSILYSPQGDIKISLDTDDGKPVYSIYYKNNQIIKPSSLGLILNGERELTGDFQIKSITHSSTDTSWKPVWGISEKVKDHYNQMVIKLQQTTPPHLQMDIIVRAYNEGVGFRYRIPEQKQLSDFEIHSEKTNIHFAENYVCYALKRRSFKDNYEGTFDPTTLHELDHNSLIGPPLLVKTPDCHIAVMEADLTNYAGLSLSGDSVNTQCLISQLAPYPENKTIKVKGKTPFVSPWRVFQITEKAGELTESSLVYNFNDPQTIADASWIKPGKVVWPWWNGRVAIGKHFSGEPGTALHKYYIDFAARHDIPYLLVDAGWYSMEKDAWRQPEKENVLTMEETRAAYYDIKEILKYARQKDIKVILWIQVGSIMTPEKVDEILPKLAEWGAKGIKIDYFGGESQSLVNQIHYIFKVAAQHQLLVDFHGSYKPTGVHRTYPHFITSEGVLGLEWAFHDENKSPTPRHNVTIPFTRMLGGPMDYTPGAFDLDGAQGHPRYVKSTRAQQMAMYVIYFSPLQMLVDYPKAYESHPEQFEFIKQVPVSWDQTRFLKGEPGEYIAMARKKDNDWFVGIMNNETAGRKISIDYDFLDNNKEYILHIYEDSENAGKNPEEVKTITKTVSKGDLYSLEMADGGGAALWFEAK